MTYMYKNDNMHVINLYNLIRAMGLTTSDRFEIHAAVMAQAGVIARHTVAATLQRHATNTKIHIHKYLRQLGYCDWSKSYHVAGFKRIIKHQPGLFKTSWQ